MSTTITKNQIMKITVGFTNAGCAHAQTTGGGTVCLLLGGDWVSCKLSAETCKAVWDPEKQEADGEGGWVKKDFASEVAESPPSRDSWFT